MASRSRLAGAINSGRQVGGTVDVRGTPGPTTRNCQDRGRPANGKACGEISDAAWLRSCPTARDEMPQSEPQGSRMNRGRRIADTCHCRQARITTWASLRCRNGFAVPAGMI